MALRPSHIFQKRRCFTLAEVVIASFVFVVVGFIGITIFVNVIRVQRRVTLENAIYEDGRFMMERIAREIRQNSIDYEEYYRSDTVGLEHGDNFGCYAQRFYDPQWDGFGALCNDGVTPVSAAPGCTVDKTTLDVNTGENPYTQPLEDSTNANAVCDETNHLDGECDATVTPTDAPFMQDQLFLINPAGYQKTFVGRKRIATGPDEYSVAMLRIEGVDSNSDGVFDEWREDPGDQYEAYCLPGYECDASILTTNLDTNLTAPPAGQTFAGFVPMTPFRSTVTDLRFYIAPLEDPRKAFAETDPADGIQQQPHVTVVMTLQPADSELESFRIDPPPTVTIQSTVSSRVYNEVESYTGFDEC